ncbi:hypothetical protein AXE80_06725 [Wenyingzhuangia fucanilytica]|uniref:DUF1761 domain-containing protein n=1 Tax=Wenyingzhuangia fucanilytica TaxID=1790137 RepID=A0A1B1Y5D8_9FLAO|nr:DUF1761 domain-containing protein [Wenyingzhuangia fucanilytica]ANW95992.1 hypothetical protein AXE80_06725 [Wenyingzhuangia fucanilytica]
MKFNLIVLLISAVIPLIIGFIWYNPKVFGTAWMKTSGITADETEKPNPIIFLWCFILSLFIALALTPIVIHQFGFFSVLFNEPGLTDPNSEIFAYTSDFMANYGENFRTFKHGALHGTITGVLIALPIIGTNALFEKKSFKYVMINAGYWTVCFCIMGGIICQFT